MTGSAVPCLEVRYSYYGMTGEGKETEKEKTKRDSTPYSP